MIRKNTYKHATHYQSVHSGASHLKAEFILIAMVAVGAILNMYYGINAVTRQLTQVTKPDVIILM